MDFSRLENSIIDVIKEEQAKLGYRKEEIRLYYPLSSLNHFFETNVDENFIRFWRSYEREAWQSACIQQRRTFLLSYSKAGSRVCA